jgi:hypothetical protein
LNTNYRGLAHQALIDDLEAINDDSDNKFIIEELLSAKDFNLFDFVKHLSDQNNKFKIQSYSMNQINTIFNDKLNENNDVAVLTPLYILKVIEGWIEDEILKYTPDGYLLTKNLNINDLPNSKEVDGYYHSIFKLFEPKWQRLLESAAIIGNKFDADILAKVWGYELLDILAFLETAVKNKLLIDLSGEDNMYQFTDKRIITAIKSHFIASDHMGSDKQIVIEYNKRYILLQQDIIENPSLYSVEDLLKVSRRLATLIASKKYQNQLQDLILEISIRFIISKDFNKLQAFSKFLESKKMYNISSILDVLSIVADTNVDNTIAKENIQKLYAFDLKDINEVNLLNIFPKNEFEKELILISCLYYDPEKIREEDLEVLEKNINEKYKDHVLFYLSYELFSICENRSEKFKRFDDLLKSLENSKTYNHFYNIIAVEKLIEQRDFITSAINHSWSDQYPEPSLDVLKAEYLELYQKLLNSNDLLILFGFAKSYIGFLSNQLGKRKQAIDFYLKTITVFEANEDFKHEAIELKMYIVTILCRNEFIKNNSIIAKEDFDTIESYVSKRYNKNNYNHFIFRFLKYKMLYFKVTKNYEEMKNVSLFHLKLMSKKVGEKTFGFAYGCGHYADALSLNGEGKKSLKWYEKKISILKNLFKKSEYKTLRISHNNLVHDYIDFNPTNHKKILKHANSSLEFAVTTDINHWIALKTYAIALNHIDDCQGSYDYYQKSLSSLIDVDIDDKEEYMSDLKLDIALVYSKIDLKKSLPMIKSALKGALDPELLTWNIPSKINIANKILKDNDV